MAIKTLRVFAEFTSTGFVPMPTAGNIDYGYTLASTFPSATPSSFQTDDPDLDVTVTAMTDFYVWIRINGTAWNPSYTRNVRVYPDSPDINNVVMNMIIATGPAGTSAYSQIVQTSNRLYFNGATVDTTYDSKFAGKTYINELNFGTAPQLATVATSGAYADLTGKPALSTVATSGLYTDLSAKPSGTAPISYNSGTNSFQITQAGASTNGSLSSADWNTFNNKQGTITLTTSGTSGASTFVGNTLNIPNYAPNLSVYVPYTGATTNVNLGTHRLTAADLVVNHVSGSGVAASITKGGSGEALTVVKTSGSGNAASITGGVTLLDELHLNTDLVDAYIASATNWNTAYTNRIVSASAPLSITSNAISITQANTSTNGFLSSTDWNTFNSKQSALTIGNFTEVNSNVFMFPDGTTGKTIGNLTIQMVQAGASTNGYLSSTDWSTFNNKQSALTFGNFTEATSSVLTITGGTNAIIGSGLSVQVKQANTTNNGFLSSTDWNTFNSKQSALTNPVTGTGTTNYIAKWTSSSAIGNSLVFDNGTSVGIATNSPKALFETGGEVGRHIAINSEIAPLISNNAYFSSGWKYRYTGAAAYMNFNSGAIIFANAPSGSADATISWTERMNITSSGNVGIGISTPNEKLMVNGAIVTNSFLGNNQTSSGVLDFYQGSTRMFTYGASGVGGNIEFHTASGGANSTERMRITSTGNVGIGTSSPDTSLHVLGSTNRPIVISTSNATTVYTTFRYNTSTDVGYIGNGTGVSSTGSSNDFGVQAVNNLIFAAGGGSERMRITSGGNVGIGMTPTAKFHVVLPSFTNEDTDSEQAVFGSGTNGNGIRFGYSQTSNYGVINALRPGVAWSNLYLQTGGGNVILGTYTNAGYKFYVAGAIYATGNITANSDLNLKKNLKLVENPIDKLNQLNGYLYQWKKNDEYQYGVIAQEVEKILPYAVTTGTDGIKGVSYNQLIPVMIEAIKVQQKEINELKSKIG